MRFTRQQVVSGMKRAGVVPLFTHNNADDAQQVLEASYHGGIRTFEFTNRRENSFEVFTHLLTVAKKYPDLMLGIGTIMDGATTKKFLDAGADFIISPILKLEMAEVCKKYEALWIPGCATLTEIVTAKDHGAEIIKLTENRAIAFKVAQCQELYDVCEKANVDYYTVRDAVYGDDPRFNLWFTFVYPDNRGMNSKCIPKDVYAWCAWAESLGASASLTRDLLKKNKEWLKKNKPAKPPAKKTFKKTKKK